MRKPGWFTAGEATRAAAEMGMPLVEFFKKYLARDFFVADYAKDNDGDRSSRQYLLSPAWGGIEGRTVPYTHVKMKAPCALLGENGCRLSFEARPLECRVTYGCQRRTRAEHDAMQAEVVAAFKAHPEELDELLKAGAIDPADDGGEPGPVLDNPFSHLLSGWGGF